MRCIGTKRVSPIAPSPLEVVARSLLQMAAQWQAALRASGGAALRASGGSGAASSGDPLSSAPAGILAGFSPEDITQNLHEIARPMISEYPIFSRDDAMALRRQLGRRELKVRLAAVNLALKFVRKVASYDTGAPACISVDLSGVGDGWRIPQFKQTGKGQYGEWDLRASGVTVEWKVVLAQLPDEDFDKLWEDGSGVLKVSIDYVQGPMPQNP